MCRCNSSLFRTKRVHLIWFEEAYEWNIVRICGSVWICRSPMTIVPLIQLPEVRIELHHNNFPWDICDGEHSRHIWLHDKYPSTFWSGLKDNRWSNKHSDSISCSISSITPKSKVHKWDADECPCNVGLVQPVRKQLLQRRFLVRYSISKKCPRRQCIQNCWEWIAEYQLCSHCPIIKSGIGRMPQICVSIDSSSRGIGECGRGVGIRFIWEYHEHLHSMGH